MNLRSNIIPALSTFIIVGIWIYYIGKNHSENNQIKPSDLYKIDSVKMLNRAFKMSGSKSNSPSGIEFEDENRREFEIINSSFGALPDETLYDTLQYSDLVMTVRTDKEGIKNYHDKNNDSKIAVYDVIIGETSFIDLKEVGRQKQRPRSWFINFC